MLKPLYFNAAYRGDHKMPLAWNFSPYPDDEKDVEEEFVDEEEEQL
jgi:hypothetical protein